MVLAMLIIPLIAYLPTNIQLARNMLKKHRIRLAGCALGFE
jgi:hypothetical protein